MNTGRLPGFSSQANSYGKLGGVSNRNLCGAGQSADFDGQFCFGRQALPARAPTGQFSNFTEGARQKTANQSRAGCFTRATAQFKR